MDLEKLKAMLKDLLAEQQSLVLAKTNEEIQKAMEVIPALQAKIAELESQTKPRKVSLPGVDEEKEKFSFFRAVLAIRTGDWSDAQFEKEVFEQTKKRAMGALGTGSAGGYIVPTQYVAEIIELLRAESVVMGLGATVLSDLWGSPIEIPKQTGGATGYWVAENADITASDLTLGQLQLTPKKVAGIVKLSNTLLKLSNPSAEALVRRDLAITLGLKIDYAALRGAGTAGEPQGIGQTPSIKTVAIGTDGGNATFDTLIDMEYELAAANSLRGALGYAFHPAVRRKFLKLKVAQYSGDTAGEYIVSPVTEQVLRNWLGYPYRMTTQIPINLTKAGGSNLTEIYFGNWSELIIGEWGGMELAASNVTSDAFQKDQTWVRCLQELDIAVRHPESFCLVNDASAV